MILRRAVLCDFVQACNLNSWEPNATFHDWQQRGHDRGAMVGDPLFVDVSTSNFNLHTHSPALDLGFQPLDLTRGVGPL
jgi:hypothetical protein